MLLALCSMFAPLFFWPVLGLDVLPLRLVGTKDFLEQFGEEGERYTRSSTVFFQSGSIGLGIS